MCRPPPVIAISGALFTILADFLHFKTIFYNFITSVCVTKHILSVIMRDG